MTLGRVLLGSEVRFECGHIFSNQISFANGSVLVLSDFVRLVWFHTSHRFEWCTNLTGFEHVFFRQFFRLNMGGGSSFKLCGSKNEANAVHHCGGG